MIMSSPKQRQMIGYLRRTLKMDDDTYYDMLHFHFAKESAKELDTKEANQFIDILKAQAFLNGIFIPNKQPERVKYENLSGRARGMATPRQLRYINVLWKQVSNKETEEEKETALNRFVYRITGKSHMHFLEQADVQKVIKAIQTMSK